MPGNCRLLARKQQVSGRARQLQQCMSMAQAKEPSHSETCFHVDADRSQGALHGWLDGVPKLTPAILCELVLTTSNVLCEA